MVAMLRTAEAPGSLTDREDHGNERDEINGISKLSLWGWYYYAPHSHLTGEEQTLTLTVPKQQPWIQSQVCLAPEP